MYFIYFMICKLYMNNDIGSVKEMLVSTLRDKKPPHTDIRPCQITFERGNIMSFAKWDRAGVL